MEEKTEYTKEEIKLIIKDMAGRLPYTPAVACTEEDDPEVYYLSMFTPNMLYQLMHESERMGRVYRPILRPMTETTPEEDEALCHLNDEKYVDYCNEHFLDYRGLIQKQLAVKLTKKNYPLWYPDFGEKHKK